MCVRESCYLCFLKAVFLFIYRSASAKCNITYHILKPFENNFMYKEEDERLVMSLCWNVLCILFIIIEFLIHFGILPGKYQSYSSFISTHIVMRLFPFNFPNIKFSHEYVFVVVTIMYQFFVINCDIINNSMFYLLFILSLICRLCWFSTFVAYRNTLHPGHYYETNYLSQLVFLYPHVHGQVISN